MIVFLIFIFISINSTKFSNSNHLLIDSLRFSKKTKTNKKPKNLIM